MKTDTRKQKERMIYQIEETRKKILENARDLFIKKGFFETQMKDIAEESHISRSSLYRYFQNKADLSLDILEKISNDLFPANYRYSLLSLELLAGKKIYKYFKDIWLNPEKLPDYIFMAEFDAYYTGNRVDEDFLPRVDAMFMHNSNTDILMDIIQQGMKDGELIDSLDPSLTAITLINSIRGIQQRILLRGNLLIEISQERASKMIDLQLEWLIKAISNN